MSESDDRNQERLRALKQLLADDPRSLAFVTLAEEHNRLGQHAEAADVAHRGLLSHPDSVAGRLALAVAEAERDNVREALEQIKRALIIDQENPRALALMGRILLKRGLAKRAVQFLSHAVKLDPKEPTYKALLDEARDMAKGGGPPAGMPVFSGDNVPDDSPWSGGDESVDQTVSPEAEHTVFDPDALKKLRKKDEAKDEADLGAALRSLPGVGDQASSDAERTQYYNHKEAMEKSGAAPLPAPRRVADQVDPREEPTAYATPNPLKKEKPKMGGSAAEYSQMMKKADADAVRAAAEERIRENPPPMGSAATDDLGLPPSVPRTTSDRPQDRAPIEAPSQKSAPPTPPPPPAQKSDADQTVDAPPSADKAPSRASGPKAKPASEPKPEPAKPESAPKPNPVSKKAPPPPNKQVGPASTRMVDDALWALFGQKGPGEADKAEAAPSKDQAPAAAAPESAKDAPPKRAPVRAHVKGQIDDGGQGPDRGGQMVVRTSERFGTWTRTAIIAVLTVTAGFTGYAVAISSAGPGPEVASEELKGIATELERGGLAALLAAEDQTHALLRANPDLAPLLSGVLAEVYARRWQAFGRNASIKQKAETSIAEAQKSKPTVELIAAMVELSTGTADRNTLSKAIDGILDAYPNSPKTWVLKSRIAWMDGRKHAALEALYRAHAIHPQHRLTLLWLARWFADHGAYSTTFNYYDQIQERYPLDVEASLERYVLGRITGADHSESQAVSALAGLVRQEIPEVAKDEAGRAALAFSIPLFAEGQLQEGLEELSKAEAAFNDSASFKSAVGGALISMGEFERARRQYKRALELEPDVEAHRIGLARAAYGERLDVKLDLVREGKQIQKANAKRNAKGGGVARLPYATLRLVYGRFQLIEVTFDPMQFPEDAYADLANRFDGGDLQKAIEAASIVAVADKVLAKGNADSATSMYEEALSLYPLPAAHFGLGRAQVQKGEFSGAIRHLNKGLDDAPDDIRGRLDLARAYIARKQPIDAIGTLEKLEGRETIVPEAMYLLGQLRMARGDYEGSLKPLEGLVDLRPRDVGGFVALGEVYARLGRSDDAVKTFSRAVDVEPGVTSNGKLENLSPAALAYLGRVELDRKSRRGVALLRKSLEYEEAPIEAHFFLGRALASNKRTRREAKRELEAYIRLGPSGERRTEAERLLRRR